MFFKTTQDFARETKISRLEDKIKRLKELKPIELCTIRSYYFHAYGIMANVSFFQCGTKRFDIRFCNFTRHNEIPKDSVTYRGVKSYVDKIGNEIDFKGSECHIYKTFYIPSLMVIVDVYYFGDGTNEMSCYPFRISKGDIVREQKMIESVKSLIEDESKAKKFEITGPI